MAPEDFWVFGYGSLMWRPGFEHVERLRAVLHGFHRQFCMTSVHYRGTPDRPGLVLALDAAPGGSCAGIAYRVAGAQAEAVLACLRACELVSYAYHEIRHAVTLEDGREVEALAYVSDRAHPQYCGGLSLEAQAEVIARAVGPAGPNAEYLLNTVESLGHLGLDDRDLSRLAALVRARL
jgi:glutathione-specific gamma-glutamylcyclotransferase